MRKIPTLFVRDFTEPSNGRYVTDEVSPGCEWVLAGEGRATRKYDGTCVLIRRDGIAIHGFARREVKPGKEPPPNWREVDHDETTGKRVGWEPIEQSGFAKFFDEAISDGRPVVYEPGTYELVGPKINGNPEGRDHHYLIPHGLVGLGDPEDNPRGYDELRSFLASFDGEGIVWHHPDGRMAKLKRRDFEPSPLPHGT